MAAARAKTLTGGSYNEGGGPSRLLVPGRGLLAEHEHHRQSELLATGVEALALSRGDVAPKRLLIEKEILVPDALA
jgi:hypothetical protein